MKRLGAAGFTLTELIVVMAVSGILVLIIASFMMDNIYQTALAGERDSQAREVQQSLDLAANDIRLSANADTNNRWPDANSPGGGGNQYGWTSGTSTLILATAVQSSDGNVIFSDAKNYITEKNNIVYFVKNGTLYKRTIANPISGNTAVTTCPADQAGSGCPADKELLHNITSFSVSYLDEQNNNVSPSDARAIQLHVNVSKKVFKQNVNTDYTTRMVFRND